VAKKRAKKDITVHPTEACAEPRIEVFQGMAPCPMI